MSFGCYPECSTLLDNLFGDAVVIRFLWQLLHSQASRANSKDKNITFYLVPNTVREHSPPSRLSVCDVLLFAIPGMLERIL